MAADSKLVLPGNFEPGKKYLVAGSTLIAWRKALLADRITPGPGLKETGTPQSRILSVTAVPAAAGGPAHPFDVTLDGSTLAVAAGYYQLGTAGSPVLLAATTGSGSFVYLKIDQDATGALSGSTPVSIHITSSAVASATVQTGTGGDRYTTTSYVLLATVSEGIVTQLRHGNFILTLWAIDGFVSRWAETIGGRIP